MRNLSDYRSNLYRSPARS